jgi:hypothetical protein
MFCLGVKLAHLDLEGERWDGAEWIHLAQNESKKEAVVNTVIKLDFINMWEIS